MRQRNSANARDCSLPSSSCSNWSSRRAIFSLCIPIPMNLVWSVEIGRLILNHEAGLPISLGRSIMPPLKCTVSLRNSHGLLCPGQHFISTLMPPVIWVCRPNPFYQVARVLDHVGLKLIPFTVEKFVPRLFGVHLAQASYIWYAHLIWSLHVKASTAMDGDNRVKDTLKDLKVVNDIMI